MPTSPLNPRLMRTGLALVVLGWVAMAAVVVSPSARSPVDAPASVSSADASHTLGSSDGHSARNSRGDHVASAAASREGSSSLELELLSLVAGRDALPLPLLMDTTGEGLAAEGDKAAKKLAKKIAKLDKKLAKVEGKLVEAEDALDLWTANLAQADLDVMAAEAQVFAAAQQLAAAFAMPGTNAQEVAAKAAALKIAQQAFKAANKALKAARKAQKKATKKIAKYTNSIAKKEAKIVGLILTLEEVDPGHFIKTTLSGVGGEGQVSFSWPPVEGASSYTLYWSQQPGVDVATAQSVPGVSSPFVASGLGADLSLYAVVTATIQGVEGPPSNEATATTASADLGGPGSSEPSTYFPPWAGEAATNVIPMVFNPGLSETDNGALLRSAVLALQPGDRLEISDGTWSIASKFSPSASGTANDPIWIVAADGATPIITRPDENQNVMNPQGSYMAFRGLEITGGSAGIKLGSADNIWIDECEIHHLGEAGIAANSEDTSALYITRNHIHHTSGYGEGMYLGANNGAVIMSESVIAQNLVHDTDGLQGDGIEVKQGSWGNWIAENTIYDANYPCLLVYGTDGQPVNLIERNILVGSGDNVLQVQGEAIVRSNLIVNGATGFQSGDHQGQTRDLTFVHNTVLNSGQAVRLSNWNNRPGMVFANNAIYSQNSTAVQFSSGSSGVTIAGNVVLGSVSGASTGGGSGFTNGVGLSDFAGAAWTGTVQDVSPATPDSALLGAGDPSYKVSEDLSGDGFGGGAPAAGAVAGP